jgi:hypothetical protein
MCRAIEQVASPPEASCQSRRLLNTVQILPPLSRGLMRVTFRTSFLITAIVFTGLLRGLLLLLLVLARVLR